MTFQETHVALAEEAAELAHMIALSVLHGHDEEIDPGLLLDYAASLKAVTAHLADNEYASGPFAFVNTVSNGPVCIEREDGRFYVYRFDRIELQPSDVPSEDQLRIQAAALGTRD